MLMAVERGHVGNHVAATKERSMYCAGPATKRHEPLPPDYDMPRDRDGVICPSLDVAAADGKIGGQLRLERILPGACSR